MPLTLAGRAGAVISAGAEIYSDPIALAVTPGADLAVSLYLPDVPAPQTGHPGARATSFMLAGEHVADADLSGARSTTRWYVLADVEVAAAANAGTIVAIGDSITDGYGVPSDHNTRWPTFSRHGCAGPRRPGRSAWSMQGSAATGCCSTTAGARTCSRGSTAT
jgi:hypothetical protein